jgi:DNA-3-methyladenine glycosylase
MESNQENALERDFFQRDTATVARKLLGKILVRKMPQGLTSGIIIETEAYYGTGDPASHAFRGATPRSRIMFGKPGVAYVYLCYGVYWLLNVVTEKEGIPGAVLIRGLKPLEGKEIMQQRRKIQGSRNLMDGPGKLTIAMGIDGNQNGSDITSPDKRLYISRGKTAINEFDIKSTARIGIKEGKDRMLRFIAVGL